MKCFRFIFFLLFPILGYSQFDDEQLALEYFNSGAFEKAQLSYQKLYEANPSNYTYFFQLVKTYQELEQFVASEQLIVSKIKAFKNPMLFVELGYNYQLKGDSIEAEKLYEQALSELETQPNFVYNVARQFEIHSLLDYAIKAYQQGMQANSDQNFNIQLARIYGEQGKIDLLFSSYMDYIEMKPDFLNIAKREFSEFISEDRSQANNVTLRRLLLKKLQSNPDLVWYDLLSWLYVNEKDYEKSFAQEKALYRRQPESLDRMINLAMAATTAKQSESALEIFDFIIDNAQEIDILLLAHQYRLELQTTDADPSNYPEISENYKTLFETYGTFEQTLPLQIAYSDFLAFYLKQPEAASSLLKESLKLKISPFQEATVKLKLGDILVFQEKFNEALLYYTQIQTRLKNATVAQEARFKIAQTSYFKGDFEWAEAQLKILKASTSQLIANDALDLKLLISDNKYEDSLHVGLKLYAKADLMAYQHRTQESIALLDRVLTEHKGENIEDQALFKQARLFEKLKSYDKAIQNYELIIANFSDDILADDALFYLAELYNHQLELPEKAKVLYEQIVFKHQNSIYFIEARKQFRKLRGDAIN